ncbi:MAG: UPF0262 family protein [Magnetovibrionaceae bacterium]
MSHQRRICDIRVEEHERVRHSPQIEHERKVAIFDLLEENTFEPLGDFDGPFKVRLSMAEHRLIFDIDDTDDQPLTRFNLSLRSLRSVIKDYFLICDSYFKAIKTKTASQIEAIDMARRGLHNEGAERLQERLEGKVTIDQGTARRLFTLICVMHIRPDGNIEGANQVGADD